MIQIDGEMHHVHGLEVSIEWKWVYYTKQSIDSMQSLSSNGIFHRTRTNHFMICMGTQKKNPWERRMEQEELTCLTSDCTSNLQSSGLYGTDTKTEI